MASEPGDGKMVIPEGGGIYPALW